MKFVDLAEEWLLYKAHFVRKSTIKSYSSTLMTYIYPIIGRKEIDEIRRKDIQDILNDKSTSLRKNTIMGLTKVLSQPFKYAILQDYINENPYNNIQIPNGLGKKEVEIFTLQEIIKLIDNKIIPLHKRQMMEFAFRTGMRIGEVLALRWEDVNIEYKFLSVKRTLSTYSNGKVEIVEPKTSASKRRIDLDIATIKILLSLLETTQGEYVFSKKDGSFYSRQSLNMKRICEKCDVRRRSFHSFRHTHATFALINGAFIATVAERLGHVSVKFTIDTYGHFMPGTQGKVVEIFNGI